MTFRRAPTLAALAAVALSLGLAVQAAAVPPLVSFDGCPAFVLYGARGSGEALDGGDLGLGRPGAALLGALRAQLGHGSVGAAANAYPAVAVQVPVGPVSLPDVRVFLGGAFDRSVAEGVDNGLRDLSDIATRCPSSSLILTGYSQGALVMRRTLARSTPAVQSRVVATVLFGDPYFWAEEPGVSVGGGHSVDQKGLARQARRRWEPLGRAVAGRTLSWCHARDGVCQGMRRGNGVRTHLTYGDDVRTVVARLEPALGGAMVTASPIRQQLAVRGRLLASVVPDAPFTRRDAEAPALLAAVLGAPAGCQRTQPSLGGRAARIASYRSGTLQARALLTAAPEEAAIGDELCRPGARALLRRLDLTGSAGVSTEFGVVRTGLRMSDLARPLRARLRSRNDYGAQIDPEFPVQDPCAGGPGVAAEFGVENQLLTVLVRGGRIRRIRLRPADHEQCRTQSPRGVFDQRVLGDGCLLFGFGAFRNLGGSETPPDEPVGCRGRPLDVRVTQAAEGTDDGEFAAGPIHSGTSADGRVAWRVNEAEAFALGVGLRMEARSTAGGFPAGPETAAGDVLAAADRMSMGLDYDAQPDTFETQLTAVLRAARPDLGDVIVGEPSTGADSQMHALYRDGRRAGYALFSYEVPSEGEVDENYTLRSVGSWGAICRGGQLAGCPRRRALRARAYRFEFGD